MKKIFWFLILFLLLSSPFPSKAAGFVLDPTSISTIESGAQSLLNSGFGSQGILPMYGELETFSLPFENGNISSSDAVTIGSAYEVELVDDETKETLMEDHPLYYPLSNNQDYASYEGDVYLVTFDNGLISGHAYVTEDGKLISSTHDVGGVYLNYKLGGFDKTISDFQTMYKTAGDQIKNTSLTVNSNFQNVSNSSYFWWMGSSVSSQPAGAWQVYIVNQYIPGLIVPATNSGYISSWYTNNPSLISYKQTHYYQNDPQYAENRLSITTGNFTKNGYSYHYQVTYNGYVGEYIVNGQPVLHDYNAWANGQISSVNYWFAQTGLVYNASYDFANAKSFVPIDTSRHSIDVTDGSYYDYSALEEIDSLINWDPTLNPDFDNTGAISYDNYPYDFPVDDTLDPSAYPLPGGVEIPYTGPAVGENTGDLAGSIAGDQLPVINNLFKRFPFSIPWDIQAIIAGLSAEQEAPHLEGDIPFGPLNYVYHFDLDFSDFDGTAALFRKLFLITFVIGLAIFSYDHFFGS